jgi:hypothetical protein
MGFIFLNMREGFEKGFNSECFMGGVIQRLSDCMGFIFLNMREGFEKGFNSECFMGGVIQRLYGLILLNMRERV